MPSDGALLLDIFEHCHKKTPKMVRLVGMHQDILQIFTSESASVKYKFAAPEVARATFYAIADMIIKNQLVKRRKK